MSLRREIFGFRLQALHELLGSGSTDAIAAVASALDDVAGNEGTLDEVEAGQLRTAKQIVSRAITQGAPFPELDVETDAHVMAAVHLARHNQSWHDVGSNSWKMQAFWQLDEDAGDKWYTTSDNLFRYFIHGRPLFGNRINTDWSYYAFLRLEEIRDLIAAIRELQRAHEEFAQPDYVDGFVVALLAWLCGLADAKLDLWFFTQ